MNRQHQEGSEQEPSAETVQGSARQASAPPPEHGEPVPGGALPGGGGVGTALEAEGPSPPGSSSEQVLGRARPYAMEGAASHDQVSPPDRSTQYNVSYRCLLRQNQVLLTALEELQSRCAGLKKENSLLRKSCFPETQEKVKHLKRKNAELAVIAKRLEERARKLQEANLKMVNAPVTVKGSCTGLCKKALARQRATDLREQASALLEKDKQISSLQQECCELQAKVMAGKEGPPCLPLMDFCHLLRESQKEVLRLQRQIALKNFKASLGGRGPGDPALASASLGSPAPTRSTYSNGFPPTRAPQQREELSSTVEATSQTGPRALPLVHVRDEDTALPVKKVVEETPEIRQQIQQLEFELRKKRKQCENLEHEVRKKHKRYTELEIQLQEIRNENVRLLEENTLLHGQVEWTEKVESENADLRLQVAVATEERDSALQKSQELQNRLESLGQALKHMKEVAGRRQQLELEHEKALQALQRKKDEVRQLQQAQAEARKEHEGAVQLLEAHVRELENQCRSHTEQFNFLSQELKWFRLQTGKRGLPLPSSLTTSEVTFASCQPSLQLLDGLKEKDSALVPVSPRFSRQAQDEGVEGFAPVPPCLPDPMVSAMDRRSDTNTPPPVYKKPLKKLESQSSSSRSESLHNSPKCCPTPEVDTASEMEELDIDSISLIPEPESQGPVKLRVFLARYSYNPFDGPNENPEAELPLTAGEYIYVYGEMDDDGFFEGELMDGRRGLVPSNFVERVSDDDLITFLPQELHELSQSSPLDRSFWSTSLSSGERSDYSAEELSTSTAPSRVGGDQEEAGDPAAVPYPRKIALLKQFGSSVLVGWEPPLLPSGHSDVQSYNVYVEAELRQNVKAGSQTKAVIEKLDLKTSVYRISVQAVWEKVSSDRLRCTFLVGHDVVLAPTQLEMKSISATSAEISWLPSSSNFPHTLYLNGEECDTTKSGVYRYTFRSLNPSTSYIAKVEAQPLQTPWDSSRERQEQSLLAEIHFTTASAGSPDAPLDVRVERGPSAGILVISWLPVTIDAEGSSNGVRVTGYAVYADGQKVMEVTSPTAGSVLAEVSQLQILQVCREVSVRTVSLYGESVDSVPAQIPSVYFRDVDCSSPAGLLWGEERASLTAQASQTHGTVLSSPVAKVTSENSPKTLLVEASPSGRSSPASTFLTHPPRTRPSELGTVAREEREFLVPPPGTLATTYLATTRTAALEEPEEDPQKQLHAELESCSSCSAGKPKTCKAGCVEQGSEGGGDSGPGCLGPKTLDLGTLAVQSDSDPSEKGAPGPLAATSGRKLLKETSRDDSAVTVPRVRREQGEKRSEPGNRPLNLLTDHSRGSDLSDIMEEEEEEEDDEEDNSQRSGRQGDSKWNPREHHSRENGEKLDPAADTDSDEEILERILEMPLQNNCSKALFSIPEVAEEEEEEDEVWEHIPSKCVSPPPEKKAEDKVPDGPPFSAGRPGAPVDPQPKSSPQTQSLFQRVLPDSERVSQTCRRGEIPARPEPPGGWSWEGAEPPGRPAAAARTALPGGRAGRCTEEAPASSRPRASQKRKAAAVREQGRSPAQPGGGLYRAHSLQENLDVITGAGAEEEEADSELYRRCWARRRKPQPGGARGAGAAETLGSLRGPSPERGLEIDIEYDDSDDEDRDDVTITSTLASQPSSGGGSPTDCEDGWSDCSSRSGSGRSSGPPELRRCSSWEDESSEWGGSPGRLCRWRRRGKETAAAGGSCEERSRSLERNPSLWRATPDSERPGKGRPRLPPPAQACWMAGNRDPQLLNSTSWQAPIRRGRQPLWKSQEVAATGANSCSWGSPPSTAVDRGDSVRLFLALFDYDPVSMSPNLDAAEEELPFKEGQILKVYGHKDADGFYRGECAGRMGYIPCNMVSEVQVDSDCARLQLLQEGHVPPEMLVESLGNGVFSPPPQRPAGHPPKPRRSKKVERDKEEDESLCFGGHEGQDLNSEDDVPRTVLAFFDCSPTEGAPSLDTEVELKLGAGNVVTVLRSMDSDGFCYGEANGQKGLVPSNFLEAEPSDRAQPGEPSLGRQKRRKRRVQ